MAKHNATAWLYRGKIVPFGEEDEELQAILAKRGAEEPTVRVYNYRGKKYTTETLKDAPEEFLQELRKRGVRVPETEHVELALTDIEGVGEEMAAALKKAGYSSIDAIAAADAAELAENVTGVGPKSAPAIIAAAIKVQGN